MSGSGPVALSPVDLALAAGFVVIAGIVSVILRLGLERRLAVASLRATVQLLLLGLVLRWVFAIGRPDVLLLVLLAMTAAAAQSAIARPERRVRGGYRMAFVTLFVTGMGTTLVTTTVIVGVEPWYSAQYVIPLLGMVLGNGLTGLSLTLDELLRAFSAEREDVEERLALGATAWEAAREPLALAVRRGLLPILNTLSVVGIVSLPGMMTGQILAGADPMTAVQYQLLILFVIAATIALGSVMMALLLFRRLFNAKHQLLEGLIHDR